MDLPMLQDKIKNDRISSQLPWETVESTIDLFARITGLLGQMGLVLSVARSGNYGIIFTLLCMAKPIITTLSTDSLWTRSRVIEATNENYLRMTALQELSDKKYRHDILSGGIVQYIVQEFKKARSALGDTPVEEPEYQYNDLKFSQVVDILTELSGDLPMLFYAFLVLLRPSQLSLSTIATLQQSSTLLRWSFYEIYYEAGQFRHRLSDLQQLYDIQNMKKIVKDGDVPYPNEKESSQGMSFELKDVTFSYPGDNSKKALDGVSFRIAPGQLVAVVGANGSGKSTFINLLTRMYDVSSGQILVDGEDIRNLKVSDFRQATATLTQEHELFPLSIAENIGLGCPEHVDDREGILDAARKGGCEALVKKLDSGYETILDPVTNQWFVMVDEADDEDALQKAVKSLKKATDVSGGERQRLVAARTFMRFRSNKVKFVAVDEPSSALDPVGELELFNNLREARNGKTMLFVTHRFGPLTKYADQIICMKDGKVAEFGTHTELMAKKGEYYTMYNIQAKAFETGPAEVKLV
ncbi:P-loop containing nucleoside triphosphate hydrolase protein [Marasmius fiardii PR-910]|nr:P-loop containing nucleoside triphosphate hydrolase protein [Marasmius fiardii PR-910]